ncbi:hypothetical protein ACFLWE_00640 [Chloroflexota bacterium]
MEKQREEDLAARAAQLNAVEQSRKPAAPGQAERAGGAGIGVSILIIAGSLGAYFFLFWQGAYRLETGAAAAVAVGFSVLLLIQSLSDFRQGKVVVDGPHKPSTREAEQAVPTAAEPEAIEKLSVPEEKREPGREKLLKWLKKDAFEADRAVRDQVSMDLVQAVSHLNEARLKLQWVGDKSKMESLKEMAASSEILRQKVSGAPQYRQVIIKEWRGKARELVSRLVGFEEELLRLSRVFSQACGRLLPESETDIQQPPTPEGLSIMLRRLERHFTLRDNVFSGIADIEITK